MQRKTSAFEKKLSRIIENNTNWGAKSIMSIFSRIKERFSRNKYNEMPDLDELTKPLPDRSAEAGDIQNQQEKSHLENVKAKLDLVLTELDNLKIQNQTMNERLKNIEKTLVDMKGIKYY